MFHNSLSNQKNILNEKFNNKIIYFSKEKKENKIYTGKKIFEISKEIDLNERCILNKKCPFYYKYIKLKNEIKSFLSSREKLKLINQSLYLAFSEKSELYKKVKEENNNLKGIIYKLTGIKFSEALNNSTINNNTNTIPNIRNKTYDFDNSNRIKLHKIKINLKKNHNINSRNNFINNIYNNINNDLSKTNYNRKKSRKNSTLIKTDNSYDSLNISDTIDKENIKQNSYRYNKAKTVNRIHEFSKNYNPNNFYEMINDYTKMQKLKINAKETNSSYLSLDIDLMNLLYKNATLNSLERFTRNDEKFIKECKTSSNDTLFKYSDLINSLISDYKEIIKLSTRMKDIIKGSILLIDSIISNDSSKKFIEITCNILKCDRASLFLFDKVSGKLILYSGEGMKKAQIKIDKDKGIVGTCFTECRVIRIEDAYLEEKFDKEVDKKTNYRTKSILCHPLVDKEGECFGVIEAINKINSAFSEDDQELLKLLSKEASSIFKSLAYNDNNKYLVTKLHLIIDYSLKIQYINNKYELSKITEETLLNLFNCMNSVMYFIKDNFIIKYKNENEYEKYDMNLGIVGKVIKFKEIIGYKDIKNSEEYNSIIDIKTFDGLLTFPILSKKKKNVCAVIQIPYFGEINKYGKPKENENKIIKKLCKCIKNWIFNNE